MAKFGAPRFTKPGKGVERDAKKKNIFFRFFELLFRKIYKLFMLNAVYLVCILPLVCAVLVFCVPLFKIPPELIEGTLALKLLLKLALWLPRPLAIAFVVVSAVFYGPITCGFTYILRNYVNEQHAWLSDLFSRAKSNFKQGFIIGMVDIVVFSSFVLYMALNLNSLKGDSMYYFYSFLKVAAAIIAVFYVFMRYYLYTLAVTFELNLKDIFKDAYLFGVLGFFRNLISTVLIAATVIAFTSTPIADICLLSCLMFSLCGFIGMYNTYPIIKKYMLNAKAKPTSEEEK